MVVTVVSKSSTSALIETFIADWSNTMTNWAMANATSGNQFVCRVAPVCAASDALAFTVARPFYVEVSSIRRVIGATSLRELSLTPSQGRTRQRLIRTG